MKKGVFYFVFLLVLASCSQPNRFEGATEVNIVFKESEILLSHIADSVTYIYLEESENSVIGTISRMRYHKGFYYVIDGQQLAVLVFDSNGKFINKVRSFGRGPGEYSSINGFDVNPKDGSIEILDQNLFKILKYSKEGKFLEEILIDQYVREFVILPSGQYAFFTPDKNEAFKSGLWTSSPEGKFEKQLMTMQKLSSKTTFLPYYFYKDNDSVKFMDPYSGVIYAVSAESAKPQYHMQVGLQEVKGEEINPFMGMYLDLESWISFVVMPNKQFEKSSLVFFNKKDNTTFLGQNLKNDLDGVSLGLPVSQGLSPNILITILSANNTNDSGNGNPRLQLIHLK